MAASRVQHWSHIVNDSTTLLDLALQHIEQHAEDDASQIELAAYRAMLRAYIVECEAVAAQLYARECQLAGHDI